MAMWVITRWYHIFTIYPYPYHHFLDRFWEVLRLPSGPEDPERRNRKQSCELFWFKGFRGTRLCCVIIYYMGVWYIYIYRNTYLHINTICYSASLIFRFCHLHIMMCFYLSLFNVFQAASWDVRRCEHELNMPCRTSNEQATKTPVHTNFHILSFLRTKKTLSWFTLQHPWGK